MTDHVDIDGLRFYGDIQGVNGWAYQKLRGWYSGAPVRGDLEDRPTGNGAFDIEEAYRSARPLKFEGALFADDTRTAIRDLWAAFSAIQADGKPFPLTVTDDAGPLTCIVTLNGAPDVDESFSDDGVSFASVQASFLAADPIKYAPARAIETGLPSGGGGLEYPLHSPDGALFYGALGSLGRVTLTNAGTAAVWPSLLVAGGLSQGFFVQRIDTGQVVRYDRVVPDGSTVGIDFRTGEVLIDGESDGSTYLTAYNFFSVGPGGSIEVQLNAIGGSSGTPTATFTIADGFW